MDKRQPWQPKSKNPPFFTSAAEWAAQLGAADRFEVEDEEAKEDSAPADSTTDKADDKSPAV